MFIGSYIFSAVDKNLQITGLALAVTSNLYTKSSELYSNIKAKNLTGYGEKDLEKLEEKYEDHIRDKLQNYLTGYPNDWEAKLAEKLFAKKHKEPTFVDRIISKHKEQEKSNQK